MAKDVKKRIIETSYNLFREKGFDDVTVADICEACEITKTTFYRYLSSKEDTLTYFFDSLNDELGDIILDLASADNHWQQIVSAFSLILNRIQHFDRELYARLWITNLKNYHGTFDEIPILKTIVTVLIKKAQDSGQIHNTASADALYSLCSDICFGCSGKWAMGLNDNVAETFANDLATALCADSSVI